MSRPLHVYKIIEEGIVFRTKMMDIIVTVCSFILMSHVIVRRLNSIIVMDQQTQTN